MSELTSKKDINNEFLASYGTYITVLTHFLKYIYSHSSIRVEVFTHLFYKGNLSIDICFIYYNLIIINENTFKNHLFHNFRDKLNNTWYE